MFVLFGVVGAFFVAPCVVVCDLFLCFGESWDIKHLNVFFCVQKMWRR